MSANAPWKQVLFAVILPFVVAYFLQRKGVLRKTWARPGFRWNIVFIAPIITFLGGWGTSFHLDLLFLPVIGFAVAVFSLVMGYFLARSFPLSQIEKGSFVLAAGMSNQGYTMGGLITFFFLGQRGYSESLVYLLYWNFFAFLICFPFARAMSRSERRSSLKRELLNIFRDVQSLPLAGLVLGLILAACGVPRPAWGGDVLRVVIPIASVVSMGSIGVSFQFSTLGRFLKYYPPIAAVKFVASPLAALGLVSLFNIEPSTSKVVLIQSLAPAAILSVLTAGLFDLDLDMANALFSVTTAFFLIAVLPILAFLI